MSGRGPLALSEYRDLIALDEPFTPAVPTGETPHAMLRRAVAFLDEETDAVRGVDLDDERRLHALLTARGPLPLPSDVQLAIDGWMQHQRTLRPTVDARTVPRWSGWTDIGTSVALWQGDITTLAIDAIVNAANAQLLGCFIPFHACIDNAIHSAAGPRLRADCHRIMAAQGMLEPTACAKVTRGYHLPARFVLHTVGPIVDGALCAAHADALAATYRACLDLVAETGLIRSLAFCSISTGLFGFPREPAARIALSTTRDWFRNHPGALDLVVFNVYSSRDHAVYQQALHELHDDKSAT